jgi:hypothetical protein
MLPLDIPVALPGLEGQHIVVTIPGLLSGPRLVVDGRLAPRGASKNSHLVRGRDGTMKTVVLRRRLIDPVPRLECDGVSVALTPSFGWRERLWLGLPVLLLYFASSVPGIVIAALAAHVNARILRRPGSSRRRYALAGLVLLVAAGAVSLVRVALMGLLGVTLMTLLFGWSSCSELTFDATRKAGLGTFPVEVTIEDERAHRALAWVAMELKNGKPVGGRAGRRLVDDFWKFARERGVDPSAARIPVFIIRGTPVFITPISHCL